MTSIPAALRIPPGLAELYWTDPEAPVRESEQRNDFRLSFLCEFHSPPAPKELSVGLVKRLPVNSLLFLDAGCKRCKGSFIQGAY